MFSFHVFKPLQELSDINTKKFLIESGNEHLEHFGVVSLVLSTDASMAFINTKSQSC